MSVAFSPDGKRLASASWDGTIRLWETATQGQVWRYRPEQRISLRSVTFSPDGRQVACAGYTDTIYLCEVATGNERRRIKGPQSALTAVAFSPGGKIIASASMDGAVLLWDAQSVTAQAVKSAETNVTDDKLQSLWADLAGADATRAHQAVWELIAAPPQAVPFLKERLHPVKVDRKRMEQLIANLDSSKFAEREKATHELRNLGALAEPLLRKAQLGQPSAEMQRRLEDLLQKLDGRVLAPEPLRTLRAIEVLEHIGTVQAREVLRALTQGEQLAHATPEAKAALERLARRSTGAP